MKLELVAYLIQDNDRVSDMPTDEILVALNQLMQASITPGQRMSCDNAACYEFLQTVKLTMWHQRMCKNLREASKYT